MPRTSRHHVAFGRFLTRISAGVDNACYFVVFILINDKAYFGDDEVAARLFRYALEIGLGQRVSKIDFLRRWLAVVAIVDRADVTFFRVLSNMNIY